MKYIKLFENFEEYDPYELMIIPPNKKGEMLIEEIDKPEPNLNLVRDLITLGANLDWQDEDDDDKTLLHKTIENGQLEISQMLIDAGVDVNALDTYGVSLAHWAVLNGDKVVLEMLIKAKANLDIPDFEGSTALYSAVAQGEVDMAKILLDAGANPEGPDYSWSPLLFAAWDVNPELVEMLLHYGANPNRQDSNGFTPLHELAGRSEDFSELGLEDVLLVAQMLLDAGAKKDIQNNKGEIPYDRTNIEELKTLLQP